MNHGNFFYDLMFYIKTAQLLKMTETILMGQIQILPGFNRWKPYQMLSPGLKHIKWNKTSHPNPLSLPQIPKDKDTRLHFF